MKLFKFKMLVLLLLAVIMMAINPNSVIANPLTISTTWGTPDPNCNNEWAQCAPDPAFTNTPPVSQSNLAQGFQYLAGGEVSWTFNFDPSPFASISGMQLQVVVVGFWDKYPGNIDKTKGQLGDFLAIDGVPFAPFLGMTDGRDTATFTLPLLSAGLHTFEVVAYDCNNPALGTTFNPDPNDPNAWGWLEGWAGVDVATLTVTGTSATSVPEPTTMLLLGLGLIGVAEIRRKFKK